MIKKNNENSNESSDENTQPLIRRHFLSFTGCSALAGTVFALGKGTTDFLRPTVLREPPTKFSVGKREDFAPDTVTPFIRQKVYIIRKGDSFLALSSVCTHLGCITAWQPENNLIACPCHGSKFAASGLVIEGPAPRPLRRVALIENNKKELEVDTAKELRLEEPLLG